MEGFDEGTVYYSYQNRESAESLQDRQTSTGTHQGRNTPTLSPGEVRRRFKAFILGFTNENYRYTYRDQLRSAVNASIPLLHVQVSDITHFDPPLATTLRESPETSILQIEKAATEATHIVRSLPTPTETNGSNDQQEGQGAGNAEDEQGKKDGMKHVQVTLTSNENGKYIRSLGSTDVSKLIAVSGIVIAASKVRCKSTAVVLKCRNCNDRITVNVNSGLGGFALPRACRRPNNASDEAPCPLDPYIVLPDESKFIDNQTLKLQELPESVPTGEMPRSVTLSCDRFLTDRVSPGVRVDILGVYSISGAPAPGVGRGGIKNSGQGGGFMVSAKTPYVRVVGIRVQEGAGYSGSRTNLSFGFDEEESMLRISKTSGLIDIISKSIAPEIFGHEDIKKAIACQLFGGALDKTLPDGMKLRGDINILLLGDPSTAKSQLLKFTERVSPISIYTSGKGSSAAGLTASVIKDKSHGEFHLEGGAMVLADGGIVCIDEFDKMRLQDRVAIHEAMEQQTISIAKAGITAVLNARSAVLAAANPAFGRYDDSRSSAENIEFQSTILSRFDLIFIVRDVRNDTRDKLIADHVLSLHQRGSDLLIGNGQQGKERSNNSMPQSNDRGQQSNENNENDRAGASIGIHGNGDDRRMDINSLKRYISYARNRASPRLSEEASQLLQTNYVSIREQMRTKQLGDTNDTDDGSSKTVPITVRQLEAIVRIAEALAKMTLDNMVNEHHVTEAIRLFKVATLDSANAGAIQSAEGALRPEVRREVQQIEAGLKRRLAIGSMASERRLVDHFVDERFSEFAVRAAIMVMVRRGDLQYRRQRKFVYRVQ